MNRGTQIVTRPGTRQDSGVEKQQSLLFSVEIYLQQTSWSPGLDAIVWHRVESKRCSRDEGPGRTGKARLARGWTARHEERGQDQKQDQDWAVHKKAG